MSFAWTMYLWPKHGSFWHASGIVLCVACGAKAMQGVLWCVWCGMSDPSGMGMQAELRRRMQYVCFCPPCGSCRFVESAFAWLDCIACIKCGLIVEMGTQPGNARGN